MYNETKNLKQVKKWNSHFWKEYNNLEIEKMLKYPQPMLEISLTHLYYTN